MNKLAADREWLLTDLREIQATYSGTDERDQRLRERLFTFGNWKN